MILDAHTGLVLEGGGMRGVFTAGALDFLMDKKVYFPLHDRSFCRGV